MAGFRIGCFPSRPAAAGGRAESLATRRRSADRAGAAGVAAAGAVAVATIAGRSAASVSGDPGATACRQDYCAVSNCRTASRHGISPQRIWWWRLDHPALAGASLGDLAKAALASCADQPVFLMLDEVVYAKDWDRWLKTFHDERWPVRVAATASATAALRHRAMESGVGRWTEQHLMPYQLGEFLDLVGLAAAEISTGDTLADTLQALTAGTRADEELQRLRHAFLLVGSFPSCSSSNRHAQPADLPELLLRIPASLRCDAVERAIFKDIPQSFGVDNPAVLERLLYALAGQCTGLLAPASLARRSRHLPAYGRPLHRLLGAHLPHLHAAELLGSEDENPASSQEAVLHGRHRAQRRAATRACAAGRPGRARHAAREPGRRFTKPKFPFSDGLLRHGSPAKTRSWVSRSTCVVFPCNGIGGDCAFDAK